MGSPSFQASNAIIYLTYGAFLLLGTGLAWKMRHQSKANFLAGNRSQSAFPIALNFIASDQELSPLSDQVGDDLGRGEEAAAHYGRGFDAALSGSTLPAPSWGVWEDIRKDCEDEAEIVP
ncbi:hypothetical protein DL771_000892 [Monosporascus sp. 5C6A]|nr:hypothetical protein DL771_000892 [Monosporascus sp. 5C6A]